MKKKIIVEIFIITFIFIFITGAPSVKSQEFSDYEFTLEEITVTAQKREENQQKVPIAMEVLSGEEIRELGRTDIDEILTNVSSVLINKASDGLRISIRGISDDLPEFKNTQASTPTVAVNKDGVFTNRKNSGQTLFDIERVEILFGPQSTLYATASPGGVLNIVSGSPKLEGYEVSGSLEVGSYNLLRTEGMMNAPINDTMALRAAFTSSSRDGYLDNGSDDEDTKSARLRAMYKPSDKFSFTITGEYTRSSAAGITGVETFEYQDDSDDPWTAATEGNDPIGSEEQNKIYANIDWDLGFGVMSIVPSYSKRDYAVTSTSTSMATGEEVITDTEANSWEKGGEIRMVSQDDFFFKWILGATVYKSRDGSSGDGDDGSWNWTHNLQETKAVYGNITYPFTDRFRTTGGLRYTDESNDAATSQYPDQEAEVTGNWVQEVLMEYSGFDYKLGLEYDLGDSSMFYTDFSTSYRTQGLNFTATGEQFPPEKLNAFTLGSKNRFFGNKIQLNAAAYYYKYRNYMPECPPVATLDRKDINGDGDYDDEDLWDEEDQEYRDETISYTDPNSRTTGDLDLYGMDVQTSLIITQKDKLDVSISYVHKEFENLYFDFIDATNDLGLEDQDYSGEGSTNSPEWTITAGYSHNFPLWNGGILTGRLDVKYQSEYFLTWSDKSVGIDRATYEPTITYTGAVRIQEAYHTSNVSMYYTHPDNKWNITGYVNNIENYAVKRSYLQDELVIGPPRTYGGILTIKY